MTLVGVVSATGQSLESCDWLLDQISEFEGQRDPKCAATSDRLEDFIYGTPLEVGARIRKTELQKALILDIWRECDRSGRMMGLTETSVLDLRQIIDQRLPLSERNGWIFLRDGRDSIAIRDLEHYGSVAYAYRAILSVQQELLFSSETDLLPLSEQSVKLLKIFVDRVTLVALKWADQLSREAGTTMVTADQFEAAWVRLLGEAGKVGELVNVDQVDAHKQMVLIKAMIAKKQEAFQEYNEIGMYVFQRNAQVYFSRHGWPKDPEESKRFKIAYNETLIQFVKDLWQASAELARVREHRLIRLEDVNEALLAHLPFEFNQLEDITFFPRLDRAEQIDVEAYDLDAFRDGGAHWTYLQMALEDQDFEPRMAPDPFALELLSEAVAHLGVLSLRVAGQFSKAQGHHRLSIDDLLAGLAQIQNLIHAHGKASADARDAQIMSAASQRDSEDRWFTDVTDPSGVAFEHRSSDWLSRFIRSYRIDTVENEVKTSIPPAFGGAGVAAEDMNNNGWPDVLLLGGAGNKLFLNNGNGTFSDATVDSGLDWRRPDGRAGEPRQPIVADFDNDGLQDVFISYVNDHHRIYRNRGGAVFEDRTAHADLGGGGTVGGPATALDFDNDGLLDIYIGYFGDYLHGINPTLARRNKNGLPNRLYRNLGGFRFVEVKEAGVEDQGWTQAVGHSDINGDNRQDLIVGNDFGTNSYYINQGDGTFVDRTRELGVDKPSFTMNVGVADLNRDHRPDFYISNIVVMEKDEKYVNPSADDEMKFNANVMANMRVVEANDLFISRKEEEGISYGLSEDVTRGYSATGWSWDADFFDYDNDGDQDLYCLTGMNDFLVYSTENPYYEDPEGAGREVRFAESHREPNVFFENVGGKLLANHRPSGLEVVYNSRSAAYLDMDMDGDLDILLGNYHDPAVLFANEAQHGRNNWVKIRLEGDPEKGMTRDAIGAKIVVTAQDLNAWREVHSTTGYLSVHPKEQHVGVGQYEMVSLKVSWPNGVEQHFHDVPVNHRYVLPYHGSLVTVPIEN